MTPIARLFNEDIDIQGMDGDGIFNPDFPIPAEDIATLCDEAANYNACLNLDPDALDILNEALPDLEVLRSETREGVSTILFSRPCDNLVMDGANTVYGVLQIFNAVNNSEQTYSGENPLLKAGITIVTDRVQKPIANRVFTQATI